MPETTDLVMLRGPARFTMTGQKLPYHLRDDPTQRISPGLVTRLERHGRRRMDDAGFDVATMACEVSTMDGDMRPSERHYVVSFVNAKGGRMGVEGVLTSRGHPILDHGLFIDAR